MNIDNHWMQYNYGCTIQEFLNMNFDTWFERQYGCTVNQFMERTRLTCLPRKGQTKEQCALSIFQTIRRKHQEAFDLIHLQHMNLSFDDWLEAYHHTTLADLSRCMDCTGSVRESSKIITWYRNRYSQEMAERFDETKQIKTLHKQEDLKSWI